MHILLVDDDIGLRTLFSLVLEDAGFQVQTASNGREGWDVFCRGSDWDVIILDRVMLQMGGEELAGKIKAVLPDLPIILISGFLDAMADPHLFQKILAKPFLPSTLLQCVEAARLAAPVRP